MSGFAFVFDEHLRGVYLEVVERHNQRSEWRIEATEVGEPGDLPVGTPDRALLAWAEANGHIVVSRDYSTMPDHLARHLAAGGRSPGVFLVRRSASAPAVVEFLAEVAHAGNPAEYADHHIFIPPSPFTP